MAGRGSLSFGVLESPLTRHRLGLPSFLAWGSGSRFSPILRSAASRACSFLTARFRWDLPLPSSPFGGWRQTSSGLLSKVYDARMFLPWAGARAAPVSKVLESAIKYDKTQ